MAKQDKAEQKEVETFKNRKSQFQSWLKNNPDNSDSQLFTRISIAVLDALEYVTAKYSYGSGEIDFDFEIMDTLHSHDYILKTLERVALFTAFFLKITIKDFRITQNNETLSNVICWFERVDAYDYDNYDQSTGI